MVEGWKKICEDSRPLPGLHMDNGVETGPPRPSLALLLRRLPLWLCCGREKAKAAQLPRVPQVTSRRRLKGFERLYRTWPASDLQRPSAVLPRTGPLRKPSEPKPISPNG